MLYKAKGVVFRFTRYGETSIIASIFTDQFGLQSYLVNGARSKKASGRMALFQPLTLLDLVVYHRENANINRIKEVRCLHPYASVYRDVTKSTVMLFLAEVLNKTVREESHAKDLCDFIIASLITLDTMEESVHNFHLIFLIKLSGFLGFGPQVKEDVLGLRITDPLIEEKLNVLLTADYRDPIAITNEQRREILDLLVRFYQEHSGFGGEIRSLPVLRELLK